MTIILLILGINTMLKPGKPELPVIRRIISGDTTGIHIDITYSDSIADKDFAPAPYPVLKTSGEIIVRKNPSVYEEDKFFPAREHSFQYLGKKGRTPLWALEVYPVRYNPVSKKIKYAVDINIKSIEKSLVPSSLKTQKNNTDTLLIAGPEQFLSEIEQFIFYKRFCGLSVDTFKIQPSMDTTEIRNRVTSENPDYLLLIGDTEHVPSFYRNTRIPYYGNMGRYTDLYYSCISDDYIPDFYLGRFSVSNAAELKNIVSKVINFDTLKKPWKSKAFFMASDDPAWHSLAEESQIYCMNKARNNGYTPDSNFAYYNRTPGTDLFTAFSGGRAIAAYSGHGTEYRWQGPAFTVTDIINLPENLRTPVVFSFACFTGDFNKDDCFMENWIVSKKRGSIISLGSSTFSFWEEDDLFERKIFDVLFSNSRFGEILDTARIMFAADYTGDSSLIKSYFEQYNLLGDPTIKIRNPGVNKTILQMPEVITSEETLSISIGGKGMIGITQEDYREIFTIGASGHTEIPLTELSPGIAEVYYREEGKIPGSRKLYISERPISEIFNVTPNPVLNSTELEFFAIPGNVNMRIIDAAGRIIRTENWVYSTAETQLEQINLENLPSGIYFLVVNQENYWNFTEKIIKIK